MKFDELVHKILTDQDFMDGLRSNPRETLEQAGYHDVTAGQIEAFKNFDWDSTRNVSKEFGCLMIT